MTRVLLAYSGVILAAIAAVLLVLLFKIEQPPSSDFLLGTWKLQSELTDGASSRPDPASTPYLGFVDRDGEQLVRMYSGDDTPASLVSLERWRFMGTSTLEEFPFLDDPSASSSIPQDTYRVGYSGNTLTLTEVYSDGSTGYVQTYVKARSAEEEASMDLTRTAAQTATACASLMGNSSANSSAASVLLPLSCTYDISGESGKAILSIDQEGDVTVTKNGVQLFSLPSIWNTNNTSDGGAEVIESSSAPFLNPDAIRVQDVTYDGYQDLAILTSAGAYNFTYDYYAFDPSAEVYATTSILEAVNPEVDMKARTITSNPLGRGLGDLCTLDTYHFERGQYVLARSESQDFADQTNFDSSGGYIRTVSVREGGKMVQVSRQYLTRAEVMGNN